jgi:hypothetical protein
MHHEACQLCVPDLASLLEVCGQQCAVIILLVCREYHRHIMQSMQTISEGVAV